MFNCRCRDTSVGSVKESVLTHLCEVPVYPLISWMALIFIEGLGGYYAVPIDGRWGVLAIREKLISEMSFI